jgi:tetraacyldisaccharide 4'-kinase
MLRALASRIYAYAVARRNAAFDTAQRPVVQCTVPVVSVGNLLAGGTGKTPVTAMLVDILRSMGHRPAIAARGYGRHGHGTVVVHDGSQVVANVEQSGDEPMDLALRCNVPVVVDRVKTEAAVYAAGYLPCTVIIVDDGFQHRTLGREVDIVIVDRATLDGALIPTGRLREPLTALRRATCVLRTTDVSDGDLHGIIHPESVVATVAFSQAVPELGRQPVLALTSIARPERFVTALRDAGTTVAKHIALPDHARYTQRRCKGIITVAQSLGGATVLTTSKDVVKLAPFMEMFVERGIAVRVVPYTATIIHNAHGVVEHLRTRCPLPSNHE